MGGSRDGVKGGKSSPCPGAHSGVVQMGICGEAGEQQPREVGDGGCVSLEMGDKPGWLGATLCSLQPGIVSPPKLGCMD